MYNLLVFITVLYEQYEPEECFFFFFFFYWVYVTVDMLDT